MIINKKYSQLLNKVINQKIYKDYFENIGQEEIREYTNYLMDLMLNEKISYSIFSEQCTKFINAIDNI